MPKTKRKEFKPTRLYTLTSDAPSIECAELATEDQLATARAIIRAGDEPPAFYVVTRAEFTITDVRRATRREIMGKK